jgi:superfamily II DNA or RNA helicase
VKLEVDNKRVAFLPDSDEEEGDVLEFKEATAYKVDGYRYDQRFIMGLWDGKRRLVRKTPRRKGREFSNWTCPIGLLDEALAFFPDVEIADKRRALGPTLPIAFDPDVIAALRPYQADAVDAFLEDYGVGTGKGMLRLPTRSGKTVIAAGIIARLGCRTLFIVQSHLLLQQTVDFLRRALRLTTRSGKLVRKWEKNLIGQFGAGTKEIGWITVASVQALVHHVATKQVQGLLRAVDFVTFDECHHLEGETWRKVMLKSDARYKLGLSATIHIDRDEGTPSGVIWLVAATGPVHYSLRPSDLIEAGWLCRPVINFVTAPDGDVFVDESASFAAQYRDGIAENHGRNELIADIARRHVVDGDRVLVTLSRLNHVKLVEAALREAGLSVAVIIGKTTPKKRRELVAAFRTGELDVLIGTVFGEGIDFPWLDVVIVGDAMQSVTLTMQRLRNLTPYEEGGGARTVAMATPVRVPVYDFVDLCSKSLARHTRARLSTYREHEAFEIRWHDNA